MFEIVEKEPIGTIIKVVGIGGAGGNAVDHMIRESVHGVEFITANTDAQALKRNLSTQKVQLGTSGLGAGAKPEAGRCSAQEAREQIAEAIKGAHMVFITAGMGGGTGTGAAPVVAEVAKEMGILTVGVVTKPFDFENRDRVADSGIEELSSHVDSLIVVLNDKLMEVLGDDASLEDGFRAADNVLRNAVGGIAEIINIPGLVNVDFQDVRTVMAEMGRAMMGSAEAAGIDRARIAAEQAAASPLLEGVELSGARGVLINLTASRSLKMSEVKEAVNTVRAFAAKDAFVIYGTVFDEAMEDRIRVTVVATGLGNPAVSASKPVMQVVQGTGTYGPSSGAHENDVPAVIRSGRRTTVEAMSASGVGTYDIPAFLRKQAD
ncbi:cell division protein FtsZ [Denitromonas ohlonensis]|uniref:Cell division protein FtsZ n=2 Tax=Denitromonas TaxID=139331 RepID=A0A557SFB5_9RHOO|nr:cell division protein FtsZ [Denitromonas ohlonensis]TVO64182.1 cell division protein FtsZ [Denitromonas ohlonensis]TVO76083.1 cell division protein FtsZ [Denitromonas ohlonensis]TVT46778.1 MAG: cell division protein FtsZ [Denitromonas halophila]TVT73218.1 MAG: cell division protein FtsZ [Denitromonas halophila]